LASSGESSGAGPSSLARVDGDARLRGHGGADIVVGWKKVVAVEPVTEGKRIP
jgi:hypothetical protein